MNAIGLRLLKSTYRKEPVVSFMITAGIVDTIIGSLGASGSLFCFGLGTVGVAVIIRWWQYQGSILNRSDPAPEYSLPPHSSQTRLPQLETNSQKNREGI